MGIETSGRPRRRFHHSRSLGVSRGGVCGMKGLELKEANMASRLVR